MAEAPPDPLEPDVASRDPTAAAPVETDGENRLGSLLAFLELLAVGSLMVSVIGAEFPFAAVFGALVLLAIPTVGTVAVRRRTWRSPSTARLSAGLALGFFLTWLAMHLSTVHYRDLDPGDRRDWQARFGDYPSRDTVAVPPVVAGFPWWGIGGTEEDGSDWEEPRSDFIGAWYYPPTIRGWDIFTDFSTPMHLRLDRGLARLWLNWGILTFAAWFLCLAIPAGVLCRLHACFVGLGTAGVILQCWWLSAHAYTY